MKDQRETWKALIAESKPGEGVPGMTRGGRACTVYAVRDGDAYRPIIGFVEGLESAAEWTIEGRTIGAAPSEEHALDLVAPTVPRKLVAEFRFGGRGCYEELDAPGAGREVIPMHFVLYTDGTWESRP